MICTLPVLTQKRQNRHHQNQNQNCQPKEPPMSGTLPLIPNCPVMSFTRGSVYEQISGQTLRRHKLIMSPM